MEVDDLRGVADRHLLGRDEQAQPGPSRVGQCSADRDEGLGLPSRQGRVVAAQPVGARQPIGSLDAPGHQLGDDVDQRHLVVAPLVGDQLCRGGEIGARVPVEGEPGDRLDRDRLLTVAVVAVVPVRGRSLGGGLDPRRVVDHLVPLRLGERLQGIKVERVQALRRQLGPRPVRSGDRP